MAVKNPKRERERGDGGFSLISLDFLSLLFINALDISLMISGVSEGNIIQTETETEREREKETEREREKESEREEQKRRTYRGLSSVLSFPSTCLTNR